ncbi:MAG: IclR family transcriptional regulator [Armatimonadota bacterium]
MAPGEAGPHVLRSAQRALSILGVVYRSGEGKQLSEVSAETGIDKATSLRILSTLVAEGIIRREASTSRYQPDMRSWIYLAPAVRPGLLLVAEMERALGGLTDAIGITSGLFLPTQDGRNSAAALWREARTAVHYRPVQAPSAVPLHASAAGRCMLAGRTPAELARYLDRPLERVTDRTIVSPAKLRRELTQIRQLGYATHIGEVTPGVSSIAVPVWTTEGEAAGAIGLAAPGEEVSQLLDTALPALGDAQRAISRLFGYEAWLELVQSSGWAGQPMPSPWDTPDPGFGEGAMPLVRTVSRMMRLMASVFRQPGGASVRELARQRGLDKTTAWRLANTLAAGDVLWQDDPRGHYRISPRFWLRHAHIMRAATSLTQLVAGVLREVAQATGATALLAFPDKEMRRSVIYQFALPQTALCYQPEYGPLAPLHVTATGKTYLAALSRLELDRYISGGLNALTGSSITSREALLAELEVVRKAGYALNREEMMEGVAACAVPVHDSAGTIAGSVAIVPLASALVEGAVERWVEVLKGAAGALSRMLVGEWREQVRSADGRVAG